MLGLQPEEVRRGAKYVSWYDYAKQQGLNSDQASEIESAVADGGFDAEEAAVFVAWLKVNEPVMRSVIAAARKPRYFCPLVANPERLASGESWNLSELGELRAMVRGLLFRQLWMLHRDENGEAIDSLLAMRQLSAHVSHGGTFIDLLVAIGIRAQSNSMLGDLLAANKLSAEELLNLSRRWKQVDALRPYADVIEKDVKVACESVFIDVAIGNLNFSDRFVWQSVDDAALVAAIKQTGLNMTLGIDRTQQHCDAFARLTREAYFKDYEAERDQWLRPWQARVKEIEAEFIREDKDGNRTLVLPDNGLDQDDLTRLTADLLLMDVTEGLDYTIKMYYDVFAEDQLSHLAIACMHQLKQTGRFPKSIGGLVPFYFDELPRDQMDGQAVRYDVRGKQAVIYSVGVNLKDDGGKNEVNDAEARRDGDRVFWIEMP